MATLTLGQMRSRQRLYLNDSNSKVWQDDDDIDLFLNHALIKFTTDMPKASACTYTIATDQQGDAHTYNLPSDLVACITLRGYFEGTAALENVGRLHLKPGVWSENDEPKGYIIDWPIEDQFYLPRQPQGTTFTLYYGAFHNSWLMVDGDTFDLGRRRWGEEAIYAYGAYLAFNPSAARRAQLEQWNRKSDANVGNPLEEEAARWLALYQSLMDEHAEVPDTWEFVREARY